MSSGRDGPSGSDDGPDGTRRRPQPPVLDLTATSVSVEPAATPKADDPDARATPPAAVDDAGAIVGTDPLTGNEPGAGGETGPRMADGAATVDSSAAPGTMPDPVTPDPAIADPASSDPASSYPASVFPAGAEPHPAATTPGDDGPGLRTQAATDHPAAGADDGQKPPVVSPHPSRQRIAAFALAAGAGAAAGALALMLTAWLFGLAIGDDGRVDAQADRIASLEARLRDLAARPPPGPDERVDGLSRRVTAGERALDQARALDARLAAAEAALAKLPAATEQQGTALAALRRRLDEVAAMAAAGGGKPGEAPAAMAGPALEALTGRIDALETAAKGLQAAISAEAAKAPAPDRAARLAAAAVALRSSVEGGTPFAAELAALKRLAPADQRLASLEPFAAAGVPGREALLRDLQARLATIKPQAPQEPPATAREQGIMERAQAVLARLVRVRPVDAPSEAGDLLAPVRAAARSGDLDSALAEVRKLSPDLAAPFDPWVTRADGRAAALDSARALAGEGLAGLDAPQGKPVPR